MRQSVREFVAAYEAAFPGEVIRISEPVSRDFDVMAPAGVFRSNAEDMLKFLRANLEPDHTAIAKALQMHNGNISKAADELGLTRASLYRRMEKYGL